MAGAMKPEVANDLMQCLDRATRLAQELESELAEVRAIAKTHWTTADPNVVPAWWASEDLATTGATLRSMLMGVKSRADIEIRPLVKKKR